MMKHNVGMDTNYGQRKKILEYLPEELKEKYHATEIYAHKSDIARYYILYTMGGIYIDADAKILNEFSTEILNSDFVVGKRLIIR